MRALPFGDDATLLDLEIDRAPDRAARTQAFASALRLRFPEREIVLGAGSVLVIAPTADFDDATFAELDVHRALPVAVGDTHEVDVIYDGEDLDEVARLTGLSRSAVVVKHSDREYVVELLGFRSGFGYLARVDDAIVVPRRASPRPCVPALSVAVATEFTAIYPGASPGGWNLIGRALRLPRFAAGDRVRFRETTTEVAPRFEEPPLAQHDDLIEIVRSAGSSFQDLAHAMDPEAFAAANVTIGNDPRARAIEIGPAGVRVRARRTAVLSFDGAPPRWLAAGAIATAPPRATPFGYLAFCDASIEPRPFPQVPLSPRIDRLPITPGPHLDRFPSWALSTFASMELRLSSSSDRVGARLEGGSIPGSKELALPTPMRRGAVQITLDGAPIVLGPDHPITGGYPVLAVLTPAAQIELARRRPGDAVRFVSA